METFHPFTAAHGLALAAIAAATALAIRAARRAGASFATAERRIGIAFVCTWIAVHGWWLLPSRFDALTTLPLQMCHLAALGAGLYLIGRDRRLAVLVYFWGLALCTQALVTPTLREGPASHVFWYFWLSHGMIVGVAAYAIAVHGFRPTWRDWRFACAAAAAYAAIVLPIDLALGANYGFLGPTVPDRPTLVDLLGPWPQRLAAIFALVAAAMAVLMVPWRAAGALRRAAR
jgi:hypothetical integral membrane protein (TIGR02206 family)